MRTSTIGAIGAGFIGGILGTNLVGLGHQVKNANSKAPSTLTQFGDIESLTPVSAADAARTVDVSIVSVPEQTI